MQLTLTSHKIWLYPKPVDFRRSIDGLSALIINQSLPVQNGIFVFHNTTRDKLKLLVWHVNGFILLYKRLERGKFIFCRDNDNHYSVNERQFNWLLAGLDWVQMSRFNELEFDDFR
jgi:transposase